MKSLRTGVAGVAAILLLSFLFAPGALAAVTGTVSRWVGNMLVFDGTTGNDAFAFDVNGLRGHFGTGSEDYIASDGTSLRVGTSPGAGYLASSTPDLIPVYINGIPLAAFVYGGGTLPAHASTMQAIRFHVRTAGAGGTTNATFSATDGTNTCNCVYACNQTTGSKRATCATGGGAGCAFPASAVITYSWTGVGDCALTSADITGNLLIETIWQ